jgi:hypothetical protein
MANFYQQGQHVHGDQYNAEAINFGQVDNSADFLRELKNLQAELNKAIAAKAIPDENAIDAEYQMKKAVLQAEKPAPDKKTLVQHLTTAKELVANVGGLAVAITGAIAAVGALF